MTSSAPPNFHQPSTSSPAENDASIEELVLSPTTGPINRNAFSGGGFTLDNINDSDNDNTPGNTTTVAPPSSAHRNSLNNSLSASEQNSLYTANRTPGAQPVIPQGPVTSSTIKSGKFRPSLRFVIALVCGIIVTIVAAACLIVTNIVSLATVRDLGISLSKSLVGAARIKAEDYFEVPVQQQQAIRKSYAGGEGNSYSFPSEDRSMEPNELCQLTRPMLIAQNYTYPTIGMLLDDGSLVGTLPYRINGVLYVGCGIRISHNASYAENKVLFYYVENNTRVPDSLIPPSSLTGSNNGDSRSTSYNALRNIIRLAQGQTVFIPLIAYPTLEQDADGFAKTSLQLGFVAALFNRTGNFMGILAMSIPSETLNEFFGGLDTTPNSNIIAIDGSNLVLASTVPNVEVYRTFRQLSSIPTPNGCVSSADVVPSVSAGIVCPNDVESFNYGPLNWLNANDKSMFSPKEEKLLETKIDGESYFIVSTPVKNSGTSFSLTILFFLPEKDILGDVIEGRNIAIIVACAIFIVAIIAIGLLIFWLLKPINEILTQMIAASQLRLTPPKNSNNKSSKYGEGSLDGEEEEFSNIQEIFALQKTYADMHLSFSSFVRYVSIDILADILDSGKLAEIGLNAQFVTTLFSDIMGFTKICERTDSTTLSECLTVYFDRMSNVVSDCGGNINNVIGDALLVAWGAPSMVINPEVKAVMCALLSLRETCVDPISRVWDEAGEMLIIRQGIHCGVCNAGNVGCSSRVTYALLSDSVNASSRLENINKQMGTRILISGDIALKTSNIFIQRFILPLQVVGKEEVLKAYEVVGIKPNVLLETVLDHDETSQSLSLASRSNMNGLSGQLASQSLSMASKTGAVQTGHISRRKNAKVTAKSIVASAMKLQEASIVCSEAEAKFVFDFNEVSNLFCDGDVEQCLVALEKLRANHPVFYDASSSNSAVEMKKLVGEDRCEANFIRPEISTRLIEKKCAFAKEYLENERTQQQQGRGTSNNPLSDMDGDSFSGRRPRGSSFMQNNDPHAHLFVFKADEK